MKTFKDLVFEQHGWDKTAHHARMDFDNGYGVSVLHGGKYFYTEDNTYEVGILKDSHLCYTTPITNDVLGWQTPEQVTEIMEKLQSYERDQY